MIGYLKGRLINRGENFVILENNGIGYKVFTTPKVVSRKNDDIIEVHVHTHVREDAFILFGFDKADDLGLFEMLITVSGVGPKMALVVLSSDSSDLIRDAISSGDAAVFTKIGGVGRKTAEKIILELKGKEGLATAGFTGGSSDSSDILNALETLGYSAREIKEILPKLDRALKPEDQIRQALKYLSK